MFANIVQFAKLSYIILLLVACQQTDQSWPRIQQTGILRVGLDPTYPPFESGDNPPLEGFDIDLANAIAADLGLTAEFVYFGYDGLYDALQTKQVDVLISALVIQPERTRDFAYSEPYFNAGQILIAPKEASLGNQTLTTIESLNNHTLAVELGAEGHVLATTYQRQLPDLTVIPYNSPDEAITAVLTQQADAVLIDSISGRLFLKNAPTDLFTTELTFETITEEPFAFVTRIEDRNLLEKLNQSLNRLKQNGALQTIDQRWLG
jgi:ABC-type amino acid transport substrate-binding protein